MFDECFIKTKRCAKLLTRYTSFAASNEKATLMKRNIEKETHENSEDSIPLIKNQSIQYQLPNRKEVDGWIIT